MRCSSSWGGCLSLVPSWRGEQSVWATLGGQEGMSCCQWGPCPHQLPAVSLSKHKGRVLCRGVGVSPSPQYGPALMPALSSQVLLQESDPAWQCCPCPALLSRAQVRVGWAAEGRAVPSLHCLTWDKLCRFQTH